ncbi:MAG: GIY-YIG nuclease family protein [Bacteroidota bacterium]|nr:GIY-YIG nuclease family protein [Bacteroidota bacterium]
MYFVYVLQSERFPKQLYYGFTTNVARRLRAHNAGQVPSTVRLRPWKLLTYTAFPDKGLALRFESYLKSGSGRAFMKKHFES